MDETAPILPARNEPAVPAVDLSGRALGEFQLLRQLGQGGMGQVYLAEQISLKRKVAIKVMRPDLAFNDVSYQRFKAEAEAIARVTHPNIVQVYLGKRTACIHGPEYVEGRNCANTPKKAQPARRWRSILPGGLLCSGIRDRHHSSTLPEHSAYQRGEVKVADFVSRVTVPTKRRQLTQTGMTMGTPLYMSPEQVCLALDARTISTPWASPATRC